MNVQFNSRPDKDWNDNVDDVTQTIEYSEYMRNHYKATPIFIILTQNEIIGRWLIFLIPFKNMYWIERKFSFITSNVAKLFPSLISFAEPKLKDKIYFGRLMQEVEEYIKDNKIAFVEFREWYSYKLKGYEEKQWGTFLINTRRPEQEILSSIKKSSRKLIKRTIENKEITWKYAETEQDFQDYHNLLVSHYKTIGFKTTKYDDILDLRKYLNDMYRVYLIKKNNVLIGGMGTISFNKIIKEQGSALSDKDDYKNVYANDFLKFIIAANSGCDYYDLAGVDPEPKPNSKSEGIFLFKKKFGGELIYYRNYTKINSRVLKLLYKLK